MITKSQMSVVDAINTNAVKGEANIVTMKAIRLKKGSSISDLRKVTIYIGATIGTDYKKEVREAQTASGHDADYQLSKVWHTYYNEWFNQHKTTGKLYLRIVMPMLSEDQPTIKSIWLADGVQVDYASVEPYLYANDKIKPREDNQKQLNEGVDTDKQVDYNLVSTYNIIVFVQGSTVWVDTDISLEISDSVTTTTNKTDEGDTATTTTTTASVNGETISSETTTVTTTDTNVVEGTVTQTVNDPLDTIINDVENIPSVGVGVTFDDVDGWGTTTDNIISGKGEGYAPTGDDEPITDTESPTDTTTTDNGRAHADLASVTDREYDNDDVTIAINALTRQMNKAISKGQTMKAIQINNIIANILTIL